MRAIVIKQYGGPEVLAIEERPDPTPAPGQVVIEIKAFGLNHAEVYFRKGVWGDVAEISGIETVAIRGATSELGQAAVNIAALMGARVIATTRKASRTALLESLGARDVLLEQPELAKRVRERHPQGIDAVLDIVGNTTIFDSLHMLRRRGRAEIPFQTIVERVAARAYKARPAKVFGFEQIQAAHRLMEAEGAGGKLVVKL